MKPELLAQASNGKDIVPSGLILGKTLFDKISKEGGHRVDRDFFLFVRMYNQFLKRTRGSFFSYTHCV